MQILVDADACPVVGCTVRLAEKHGVPVTLLCDTNHVLQSEYAQVRIIGAGADAVDFALVNLCRSGDIVVTQDYGLAALALTRGARPIHQSGMLYTQENIDSLLTQRYLAKKARMASGKHHLKGPPKRTPEDDARFCAALERLLQEPERNGADAG